MTSPSLPVTSHKNPAGKDPIPDQTQPSQEKSCWCCSPEGTCARLGVVRTDLVSGEEHQDRPLLPLQPAGGDEAPAARGYPRSLAAAKGVGSAVPRRATCRSTPPTCLSRGSVGLFLIPEVHLSLRAPYKPAGSQQASRSVEQLLTCFPSCCKPKILLA